MKYAFILSFLICSSNIFAQQKEPQVYKFRAFQTTLLDDANQSKEISWHDVDILVVINLDKNKVHIYAENEQDLDLLGITDNYKDNDKNDWLIYKAVDKSGIECKVKVEIFADNSGKHIATLFIRYGDGDLVYRLKKND